MSKAVITIALWLIVSAAQWVAADKLRLGVAPFEVGGQINREAGNELAAFVVGILGDRYRIKERLQLPTLVKEALVQSPSEMAKADQELRQNLQVDLLFLGRVTRTAGDYTLLVRMCDLRGDLSFRDTISASSWEALKEKLRLSLIRHKLAPLDAVESKAPVTFVFIDAHGRRHPARLHLEGKNHSYRIDGPTPVVPGRYRFRPLDQSWATGKHLDRDQAGRTSGDHRNPSQSARHRHLCGIRLRWHRRSVARNSAIPPPPPPAKSVDPPNCKLRVTARAGGRCNRPGRNRAKSMQRSGPRLAGICRSP